MGEQRDAQNSILNVKVMEQHERYAMTALSLGEQRLWVNRVAMPLNTPLRIRVNAVDVSLVLQPPTASSIRNVLECIDVDEQVEVKLSVGGKILWARISPWARDDLGLRADMWLYAQIKSVSITA